MAPFSQGYGAAVYGWDRLRCRCVWVGQGFEGFLDLREKVLLLNVMPGGGFPPQVQFFCIYETLIKFVVQTS